MKFSRACLMCVLVVVSIPVSRAQAIRSEQTESVRSRGQLLALFEIEENTGASVFYSQDFVNSHRHRIRLSGSLYGVASVLELEGCAVKLGMTFQDRYSGKVGDAMVDETKSTFKSTFEFVLTKEIADRLSTVTSMPVQLSNGPRSVCAGRASCDLDWVRVQAKQRVIRQVSLTDDVQGYDGFVKNFDGPVDHFQFPVSSQDVGKAMVAALRGYADVCGK